MYEETGHRPNAGRTLESNDRRKIMEMTSPAFGHEGKIPEKFTCQGKDVNPELRIEDIPEGTASLALIIDDPDAPSKTWLHWMVYDIPAGTNVIEEDSVPGTEGSNDFGKREYGGPCPPSGEHRYYFRAFALDEELGLDEGKTRSEVEEAMKGHVIGNCEMMAKYGK